MKVNCYIFQKDLYLPVNLNPAGIRDKPVIFAFHAYLWLIHRMTYSRTNHQNIHVRGYKEEGTITTPFDMTVMNETLRDGVIDRLPQRGDKGINLKQQLKDKLIEHKQYIDKNSQYMPEIRKAHIAVVFFINNIH